jgi:hypothetical protein
MPDPAPTIIDTSQLEWISGPDLLDSMKPEFRANLGPQDEVNDAFSHYLVKPLLREAGGRTMDLAQFTPGYRDATACYHRSSEEGFVIDGTFDLAFEGHFAAENYFWRPPGWVHGTIKTDAGATAIFTFEGENAHEQSGPVTRTICDYSEAGTNPLLDESDPTRIGPRGYVPNVAGSLVARQPGNDFVVDAATAAALDGEHFISRVLSQNINTGGGSFLWNLAAGYQQPAAVALTEIYHFFVISGEITIGDQSYPAATWVYVPAGVALDRVGSATGATLYVKADAAPLLSTAA